MKSKYFGAPRYCGLNGRVTQQHRLFNADYYSDYFEVDRLKTETTRAVITKLKRQFSIHWIPHVVQSYNGSPFPLEEFELFASAY